MAMFAALDVSQDQTAICMVDKDGAMLAETKVPTCPEAITNWLAEHSDGLERVGMETGPLAVWLWNELVAREVPIICLDARHANGVLKMMPNKTDRHDARGLAQIVRTGWFKAVQIKSHDAYVNRAMLTAREALVGMRVRLENEVRGLLKTFGVMFGKRVGGFKRRADEIIAKELLVAPELVPIFKTLIQARRDILSRIAMPVRGGERDRLPKPWWSPLTQLVQSYRRKDRPQKSQGGSGKETCGNVACDVAH